MIGTRGRWGRRVFSVLTTLGYSTLRRTCGEIPSLPLKVRVCWETHSQLFLIALEHVSRKGKTLPWMNAGIFLSGAHLPQK